MLYHCCNEPPRKTITSRLSSPDRSGACRVTPRATIRTTPQCQLADVKVHVCSWASLIAWPGPERRGHPA